MALIIVNDWDGFDQWREKTRLIAQAQGDLDLLDPVFFSPTPTNLVDAINEVVDGTAGRDREVLVRAIAMS